ncbi:hypothetical protein ZIOFF_023276 [Zingiber officinale]|uniref:Protein RFT1 homolog n=1 Tax=Zingiber officinale TaxID=94328 RepID=A0A8J5LKT9_ZINOF|nr:hypothetical protein ZIOFF_023276 [Zingiber officinale]
MGKDISGSPAAAPGSATAPTAFPTRHNLARTFKYLMATQFLSRGIPFIFNSLIVRHLTVADYAVIFLILMQNRVTSRDLDLYLVMQHARGKGEGKKTLPR